MDEGNRVLTVKASGLAVGMAEHRFGRPFLASLSEKGAGMGLPPSERCCSSLGMPG